MRESSIVKLLVGGALTILTALSVVWFLNNFEQATREITTGYSPAAINNPLLAAERFLTRLGVKARSVSVSELWSTRPQPGDDVVFYRFTLPHSQTRQEEVRKWVEAGGHLIIDADVLPSTEDDAKEIGSDFISALGAKVAYPDYEEEGEEYEEEQQVTIQFEDVDEPVTITMPTYRYLVDSKDQAVAGARLGKGYGLLQYAMGDGYVTILSDNSFLFNHQIGDEEHALALALLVGVNHDDTVWLVHDVTMPSLLELAWEHAPQALIALLAALVLWLWSLGKRLGPQLPPAHTARRDIGEHLAATAHYLWRLDRGQALLQANRARIEQAWLTKHYLLRAMSQQERCEWIAARTGLSPAVVERALYTGQGAESDFIEMSSYLQILRAAL